MSFLTLTLPKFGSDLLQALEVGSITSDLFVGWTKRNGIPVFLQRHLNLIFERTTGTLFDDPNKASIQCVHQICNFWKKILIECAPKRTTNALEKFIQVDDHIGEFPEYPADLLRDFGTISDILWSSVFPSRIDPGDLTPHHGPGATAERINGHNKYNALEFFWPERLNEFFNGGEVLFSSDENYHLSNSTLVECDDWHMPPVRVVCVPKTAKGPRIIAIEPVTLQMTQQGVKDYIVNKLENHYLTRGHLNFANQSVNQKLALESSITKCMATLDLAAASDRVHKDLVYRMLSVNPSLRDLVFVTRSDFAEVEVQKNDSRVVFLNKFASMGSALCFPIESMFFYTICVLSYIRSHGLPLSLNGIKTAVKEVYVYGDDIIIPTSVVDGTCKALSDLGNVVGLEKSFWKGHFRESCGCDAYDGLNITPVYMRRPLPCSMKDSNALISTVSSANQLYEKGFVETSETLKQSVEQCTGQLPCVGKTCSGLGWNHSPAGFYFPTVYDPELFKFKVQTYTVHQKLEFNPLEDYGALTKCLLKYHVKKPKGFQQWQLDAKRIYDSSFASVDHLEFSPRIGALTLKRHWVDPCWD
jgi:hypothetical protein